MSRRTRRSSPRRSHRCWLGAGRLREAADPLGIDDPHLDAASRSSLVQPAHSRRLLPSPPCSTLCLRSEATSLRWLWCGVWERPAAMQGANARIHLVFGDIDTDDNADHFVPSSTPFLAVVRARSPATVRVEEDTGAVPRSVQARRLGRNGLSSSNGRLCATARSHILPDFLDTRAQGMPDARCTRGLMRNVRKKMRT